MRSSVTLFAGGAAVVALVVGLTAFAQDKKSEKKFDEKERTVKESEVPAAALSALRKQAGAAAITQFEEEMEHGHKFYEGSWKTAGGKTDVLVTESGDLVEIEETVSADQVPATVRSEVEKDAGKDAKIVFEKKTMIMYEAHFKKGDKRAELVLTPDGRRSQEEKGGDGDEDDDD